MIFSLANLTILAGSLPTALPDTSGKLWLNGRVLCMTQGDDQPSLPVGDYGDSTYGGSVYG